MSLLDVDPYFLNQKEVITSVTQLRQMLSDRDDMLHDLRGVNPDVFKSVGNNMLKELQQARNLLQDIRDSINIVRSNPSRFQISEMELNNRDSFYQSSIKELEDIETQMNTQTANQRVQFTFQPVPIPQEEISPNPTFQLEQRHEEKIDQIADNVNEQLQIGKMIIDEIEEHSKIIIDLDNGIDNANDAMKKVTNQITQLIENEGKVPTLLVAGLSLALIVMLFIIA
ncbi:hypothetical protein TRFO_31695 [Tritrichomonas foetus]|uniref:t-SNARE coiled-coil homology domain-containing protein n=1 Tax=Tritrichomonas foetus TaxID=1144522 RepID=A0A1J4JW04_9EUKA|nr:hypothetical protein TRFO_31695 [Tritrichomonas foetus]|eukprot:OHT01469.1 hypothetical protein TRFO_31695 [Tritrichomonas foetus]